MNKKILISLLVLSFHGFSQQVKVQTEEGLIYMENPDLCTGKHWTEAEGKQMLDVFSNQWNDQSSWEERADIINKTILKGIQWDKMPQISGNFNPTISPKKIMDGYSVENIAIESFPYICSLSLRPGRGQYRFVSISLSHRATEKTMQQSSSLTRSSSVTFLRTMTRTTTPIQI